MQRGVVFICCVFLVSLLFPWESMATAAIRNGVPSAAIGCRASLAQTRKKNQILIVDDYPLFVRGLTELINSQSDLVVRAQADNVAEALRIIEKTRPDLIITGVKLRNASGYEFISIIKKRFADIPILVFVMRGSFQDADKALQVGATGVLLISDSEELILTVIRKVADGHLFVTDEIKKMFPDLEVYLSSVEEKAILLGSLTARQREVFGHLGKGHTVGEIATMLHLSPKTVYTYCSQIMEKLNVKGMAQLRLIAKYWVEIKV